ncbi:MAG TPA: hypothetical protein VMG08_18725 [Allosphingosinicella sp.]|nr:hypothetical protein [Allosphingosinicella sp.]
MSLLLLLSAFGQAAAAPAEPAYEARPFAQALQDFERLCVTPLPSQPAFIAAMDAGAVGWRRVPRTADEIFGSGLKWRAPAIGQITYHYNERIVHVIGGPACHLEFRTDASFRHDAAAASVERQLGLPPGTDTSDRRTTQNEWEMRRADGMEIRVFLTSNVAVPGGPGARLSISRRNLAPLPREMTGR